MLSRDDLEGLSPEFITWVEGLQQSLKDHSSVSGRLAEANERLTAERDEAWKRAGHAEEQWGRCEVKLLKTVEALRKLATSQCFGKGDVVGMSIKESPMGRELMARMEYARTVLSLNDFVSPKREIVDDEGRFILGYVAKQKGEDK